MDDLKKLNWAVIAPVAMLVVAIASILWLDFSTGGEAEPDPYLGTIGTPVRGTFVPPTPTPEGAEATPEPRPTFVGIERGTALERDATRRGDLIRIMLAANATREREGAYPSTGGNIQTLCAFKDLDVGCGFAETIEGGVVPEDPFGEPIENGYWYSSDGQTVTIYAALELEIPDAERCFTDNVDLRQKASLVCIEAP